MTVPTPPRVAVIGSGYMGGGIAQVLARNGHRVALADISAATAEAARTRLIEQAVRFEAEGLFASGDAALIAENLIAAATLEDAVSGAEYITEAVPETPAIKREILGRIGAAAAVDAVVGSNTSAIPIGTLAEYITAPQRFLGVHWMNPAPFIPGVEIIPGAQTAVAATDYATTLISGLGKVATRVADSPGFVANRLQFALYREAAAMVAEGIADPARIDEVVANTFGFRLALFGPFAIGDMAGLDVYHSSYATLAEAYGERFSAPAALTALIGEGNLGLKSGSGFLDIPEARRADLLSHRDRAYARLSALRTELGPAPGLHPGA